MFCRAEKDRQGGWSDVSAVKGTVTPEEDLCWVPRTKREDTSHPGLQSQVIQGPLLSSLEIRHTYGTHMDIQAKYSYT